MREQKCRKNAVKIQINKAKEPQARSLRLFQVFAEFSALEDTLLIKPKTRSFMSVYYLSLIPPFTSSRTHTFSRSKPRAVNVSASLMLSALTELSVLL